MSLQIDRRELLEGMGKVGAVVAAGGLAAIGRKPEVAHAAGWEIKWGYSQTGIPQGNKGDILPFPLITGADSILAMTTGDFKLTDSAGKALEFVGKGDPNVDRISLILVDGPVSVGTGGTDVVPFVRTLYNWVGASAKPAGGMTAETWQQLIDERTASIRDPKSANGKGGTAFTGFIDVTRINGKTGRILETRVIYPV